MEAGRFHRGLAATLVVLAALIAVTALVRHHDPLELAALGLPARLHRARRTPAGAAADVAVDRAL